MSALGSLAVCRRCGGAIRYTAYGWGHIVARHGSHRAVPREVSA